jgi:hypothetical protein
MVLTRMEYYIDISHVISSHGLVCLFIFLSVRADDLNIQHVFAHVDNTSGKKGYCRLTDLLFNKVPWYEIFFALVNFKFSCFILDSPLPEGFSFLIFMS